MKGLRVRSILLMVGAILSFTLLGHAQKSDPSNISKYLGPGSCAAAACHGNIAPQATASVRQNEYTIWVVQDRHASAFRALQNPVSQRMGRLLGIGKPEQSTKCLACHALHVPSGQKGRNFDANDGVSCENCHGPSSLWLGNHSMKGWGRAKSLSAGMVDVWDPVRRSEQCLSCHLGNGSKQVDHEMIAAGHPDLVFDLESYSAAMPPHWKMSTAAALVIRTWAVGQAVQLREALSRLARRSETQWPEYSEFECYACHHNLASAQRSWRQRVGYEDRPPGNPPWNIAHFAVLRVIAAQTDRDVSGDLEKALEEVFKTASDLKSDPASIKTSADRAAAVAGNLAARWKTRDFQKDEAARVLRALSTESEKLANKGPKTAEQATMALQTLAAIFGDAGNRKEFDLALKALYKEIESPSTYDAARFADHLRHAAATLR